MKAAASSAEMLLLEMGNGSSGYFWNKMVVALTFLSVRARAVVLALCVVPQQVLPGMWRTIRGWGMFLE